LLADRLSDAVRLAERAREADVTAELEVWDCMWHVWHLFARYVPESRSAIDIVGANPGGHCRQSVKSDFDGTPENGLPEDFQVSMTGEWKRTEWGVRYIEGNGVLAHVGFWDEDPEGVFPVAWVSEPVARDLVLTVRFFPVRPPAGVEGAIHDGAGIVVRLTDPDNYYLLRAFPYETRVRFYKVENGRRSTPAGKDLEIPTDQWHELKLMAVGSEFTAYFNGEKLFSCEDESFKEAGGFGLWCKPNNVTYYDDLVADIIN
jgi:hypothetical protein